MKKWKIFAVVSCLCFVVAACAGAGGFADDTIRYKMTVTVETPEGIKTGSAVREASRYTEPSILPEQGGTFVRLVKGEAVIVDLGHRGVLFAALGSDDEARAVFRVLNSKNVTSPDDIDLPPANYPPLVFFKEQAQPKSIESVIDMGVCADPVTGVPHSVKCIKKDRCEEAFGAGTKLKSITIANTNEAPQFGKIKNYLPWFREPGNGLGLNVFDSKNPDPAKYLISDDFQIRGN